jgi:hypothetical protein
MRTLSICSYGRLPMFWPGGDFSPARKLGATAAAAVVATLALTLALGFAPAVSARTSPTLNPSTATPPGSRGLVVPPLTNKAAMGPKTADDGGQRDECAQNWPYYARGCLRDERQPDGRARRVRLIALDRMSSLARQQ